MNNIGPSRQKKCASKTPSVSLFFLPFFFFLPLITGGNYKVLAEGLMNGDPDGVVLDRWVGRELEFVYCKQNSVI